jgi:hypothetical protein
VCDGVQIARFRSVAGRMAFLPELGFSRRSGNRDQLWSDHPFKLLSPDMTGNVVAAIA